MDLELRVEAYDAPAAGGAAAGYTPATSFIDVEIDQPDGSRRRYLAEPSIYPLARVVYSHT